MSNDDIPAFQPAPFVNGRRGLLARSLVDNLRLIRRVPYARAVIPATGELAITHIGHATNLIQTASASVLTDPIWGKRALLVKRRVRPGLRLRDLPNLDAIVVSHAHFDHLHRRTLKRLPNDVPLVIYKGMESLVEDLGFERIISLQWWETVQLGRATVHAVPSNHWGKRLPWEKEERSFGGYVIETAEGTVYFGGDTAYFEGFKEIGRRFRLDVAMLPIGAYNPWRPAHCNPEDAAQAFHDLGARHLIPYHWGAFRLSYEPMDEPVAWLQHLANEQRFEDRLHILEPGKTALFNGKA